MFKQPKLKQLLYSDLARQYQLERRPADRLGVFSLLRRLCHHRFLPIVLCRVSRAALLGGLPVLSGLLSYLNLVLFGLEVAPRCEIGPGIFFPHPTGTVIGARRIGSNVTIFQGVTLGAKALDMGFEVGLRPEVGDDVVIGAGAKILGGIRIGDKVIIGANSAVIESVESGRTVAGIPAHPVSKRSTAAVSQ